MKCMQLDCRSGRLLVLVSNFTSAVEMFPMTLLALSTTATEVSPSSLIKVRASVNGRSPLDGVSMFVSDNLPLMFKKCHSGFKYPPIGKEHDQESQSCECRK